MPENATKTKNKKQQQNGDRCSVEGATQKSHPGIHQALRSVEEDGRFLSLSGFR